MKNWKTTSAGIGAILVAIGSVLTSISGSLPVDYTTAIAAILAGIGLIVAKDASKE